MRRYDARLAKLEAALKPPEQVTIRIVYFDADVDGNPSVKRLTWGDNPPLATVAPGLIDKLQDDTAVTSPPAAVDSYPGGSFGRQSALAPEASPGEQEPGKWDFQTARRQFQAEMRREERMQRLYGQARRR